MTIILRVTPIPSLLPIAQKNTWIYLLLGLYILYVKQFLVGHFLGGSGRKIEMFTPKSCYSLN